LALAKVRWHFTSTGYAAHSYFHRGYVFMHRVILGAKASQEVDHINGDALDNRRANLRLCTRAQNAANRRLHANNKSGYRGVGYSGRQAHPWAARIRVNYKLLPLGNFATPEEAAVAYDRAALDHFGQFARTNF
jgi:hypothetical protein